jgi:hypothetical protein
VDDFHKKKRNEKLFGARSEGEIKQQLAEIERAAKEAVAADKLETTGLFYQVILLDKSFLNSTRLRRGSSSVCTLWQMLVVHIQEHKF